MKALMVSSVVAAISLAGCTSSASDDASTRRAASSSSSTPDTGLSTHEMAVIRSSHASATAPATFRDRTPLAECGEQKLVSLTGISPREFACLQPDDPSMSAELVMLRRTVEGDPVVTYYRVGPDIDGIEVFRDNTRDSYRSEDWTYHRYTMDELAELGI